MGDFEDTDQFCYGYKDGVDEAFLFWSLTLASIAWFALLNIARWWWLHQ